MTFEWEDITDEVREKIVFIHFFPPSTDGFIETMPQITSITEDGQEYFAKTVRIFPDKRTGLNGNTYEVWVKKSISKTIYEVLELFLGERLRRLGEVGKISRVPRKRKVALYIYSGLPLCVYPQRFP